MSKNNHPNKEIRQAIDEALNEGWRLEKSSGHAHSWGTLYCPLARREGCHFFVRSTPSNPQAHANALRRVVNSCPHSAEN